jgi:hypothetical protein
MMKSAAYEYLIFTMARVYHEVFVRIGTPRAGRPSWDTDGDTVPDGVAPTANRGRAYSRR